MKRIHILLTAAVCLSSFQAVAQKRVEYFWDVDPGVGKGQVLRQLADTEATVTESLDVGQLPPGIHILGLRTLNTANDAKKTDGNGYVSQTGDNKKKTFCSQTYTRAFFIPEATEQITRIEYSWDKEKALGKGTALSFSTNDNVALASKELSVGSLTPGLHTLYVRTLSTKHYSASYARLFFIPEPEQQVTRMEYSWDKDVAPGKGTPLQYTVSNDTAWFGPSLSVKNLSAGIHTLYLRTLSGGLCSQTYTRSFYVPAQAHNVEAIEYWFDNDPGVGKATRMAATLTTDTLKTAFDVSTDNLADGIHLIGLRTLTDGTWSETKVRRFLVRSQMEGYITRVEYFWNNDPGAGNGYMVDITPGEEVSIDFEADMTELGEGPHTLGLRARSGSKGWSPASFVSGIAFEGWDNLQEYLNSLIDTEDVLTGSQYSRQFPNKDWHALYVPFSLSYSDWSAHFDVARINAFYQYDEDEDGIVDRQVLEAILVKPANGSLKPNYPYLIRAKQKGTFNLTLDPAKRVAEEINSVSCSTMEARYTFTGNYSDMTGMKSDSKYRLRGTSLSIPDSDEEVLPPYRWYMTIDDLGNQLQPSASYVRICILGEDGTTVIDDIDAEESITSAYDLSGRKVNESQMRKGIYIINNKKRIVK